MRAVTVFLIGGGRDPDGVRAAHAPFLSAIGSGSVACVMYDEEGLDIQRWIDYLPGADVRPIVVGDGDGSPDLGDSTAVYVAGGWTPGYQEALVGLDVGDRPYAGYSAGAAIAAGRAIVGGWRYDGRDLCRQDASEDLEDLEVRDGLGLVPFAVDVHATQWGTLTRAVHAVHAGLVGEAIAIDEHTCVEVRDREIVAVHGLGVAYVVAPSRLDVLAAIRA